MQAIARNIQGAELETGRELAFLKLRTLCASLGRSADFERLASVFRHMAEPWPDWRLDSGVPWTSDITDSGVPFELSVGFHGDEVELRFLLEAQSSTVTRTSTWQAGLEVNQRLAREYGADLSQFDAIAPLFAPIGDLPARFLLWHAAVLGANGKPRFKVYVNPAMLGAGAATRLLSQVFATLGKDDAFKALEALEASPGVFEYFSLDLAPSDRARIKVYRSHPRANARGIAEALASLGTDSSEVECWLEELTGTSAALRARPVLTCHAFRPDRSEQEVTLHVPVRAYAESDAEALSRALRVVEGAQRKHLAKVVPALANGPLDESLGLLTYMSLRRGADGTLHTTAYLAPDYGPSERMRLLSSLPPPMPRNSIIRSLHPEKPTSTSFADVERAIARQRAIFSEHPFFERLRGHGTVDDVRAIAQRLSFFVLGFQDVLRLVHERIEDPALKELARTHRKEDSGHELWFLEDLKQLGVECDVRYMFSAEHALTRDIAYRQIADVLTADDCSRFSVALALEAAGAVFFAHIIGFLERIGHGNGLRYFARSHQHVEQSHEIFDDGTQNLLQSISVPNEVLGEVLGVVDRTFASLSSLNDELEAILRGLDEQRRNAPGPLHEFSRLTELEVDVDRATLTSVAQDFGGIVRGKPLGRVRLASSAELNRVVSAAAQTGLNVTLRGAGLSQSGQAVARNTLTIDMSACRRVDEPSVGDRAVRCEAGATFRDVLARTLPHGLVPRVTPLNLDLTVGGVLSAGGFGSTSHRMGPLVSNVRRAEVVLANGESVETGPDMNRSVFDAVLAGVGDCGAIATATLELMKVGARVRTYFLVYEDLGRLLHDAARIQPRADHLELSCSANMVGLRVVGSGRRAPLVHWLYGMQVSMVCDQPAELSTRDVLRELSPHKLLHVSDDDVTGFYSRYDARFDSMRKTGAWDLAHPWFEVLLPGERAAEFIKKALGELSAFWGDGHRISLVAETDRPRAFAVPDSNSMVGFSVLPVGIPQPFVERALSELRALDVAARDMGGKRYLSGWIPDADQRRRVEHHGSHYAELAATKRRLDPTGVFRSGLFVE
jgi:cytokinin dehydrogenase